MACLHPRRRPGRAPAPIATDQTARPGRWRRQPAGWPNAAARCAAAATSPEHCRCPATTAGGRWRRPSQRSHRNGEKLHSRRRRHQCAGACDCRPAGSGGRWRGQPAPAELPIVHARVRAGTGNLRTEAAMSLDECRQALAIGRASARRLHAQGATLLIAGDMGIGNTTASACLVCAFTGARQKTLSAWAPASTTPAAPCKRWRWWARRWRARAGGRRDGGKLAGAGWRAGNRRHGRPVAGSRRAGHPALLDGFIATAAALAARHRACRRRLVAGQPPLARAGPSAR